MLQAKCQQQEIFNSHPHKEDDYRNILLPDVLCFFNSHPHKEDDEVESIVWSCMRFSTHILTRRMTPCCNRLTCSIIFQLTSSQGG